MKKQNPQMKLKRNLDPEFIHKEANMEYWWNISIKTSTRIPHNKPDLIIWDNEKNTCKIVEFSCPSDVNVTRKVDEKVNSYGPLIRNMQMMYPKYRFVMVPIIIGALGYVPKCIVKNLEDLGFEKKDIKNIIRKLEVLAVRGIVKICKTFLKFRE